MPHFHHFSICNHNQSMSKLIICHQNTKAIALPFGHNCLIFITCEFGLNISEFQIFVMFHQNTKAIALPFSQNASFSSIFNLQSQSINFKFGHLSPKYQGYSLTVWPNMPHFHQLSICNHNQSISNFVICHQNTKAIALPFGQHCLSFITFHSAIKINQFQMWSLFTKIPRL